MPISINGPRNRDIGIWVLRPYTQSVENALLCCDPRCESLKVNLPEGGCGSLSSNGFAFVRSW